MMMTWSLLCGKLLQFIYSESIPERKYKLYIMLSFRSSFLSKVRDTKLKLFDFSFFFVVEFFVKLKFTCREKMLYKMKVWFCEKTLQK